MQKKQKNIGARIPQKIEDVVEQIKVVSKLSESEIVNEALRLYLGIDDYGLTLPQRIEKLEIEAEEIKTAIASGSTCIDEIASDLKLLTLCSLSTDWSEFKQRLQFVKLSSDRLEKWLSSLYAADTVKGDEEEKVQDNLDLGNVFWSDLANAEEKTAPPYRSRA